MLTSAEADWLRRIALRSSKHSPTTADFYSGSAGQAWFIDRVGLALGVPELHEEAQKKATLTLELLHRLPESHAPGYYLGAAGALATLAQLQGPSPRSAIFREIIATWCRQFPRWIANLEGDDLFVGWAGLLIAIDGMSRYLPPQKLEKQDSIMVDWLTREIPERGIRANGLGLAHGSAGVAYGLKRFSRRVRWSTGLQLARYLEKSVDQAFRVRYSGWCGEELKNLSLESWCNGAAGIILARRNTRSRFQERVQLNLIIRKLTTRVLSPEIGFDPHYCHGIAGFHEAWLSLDPSAKNAWNPMHFTTNYRPGLLLGTEGLAYHLLRIRGLAPTILTGIGHSFS